MNCPKAVYLSRGFDRSIIRQSTVELLRAIGGMETIVRPGDTVLMKPNFVAPFPHATTNLDILETVIAEVKRCDGKPIIGESSGFEFDTEKTFRILGLHEFADRLGVELVNFDKAEFMRVSTNNGLPASFLIPKVVLDADVIINIPKLKRHSLTDFTCGMKNLFGIPHRSTRRTLHAVDVDKGIVTLNKMIKPAVTVVDGLTTTSRAVFGASDCLGVIVAGRDIVSLDKFCCGLLDLDYHSVRHIRMAAQRNGANREDQQPIGEDRGAASISNSKKSVRDRCYRLFFQLMYAVDLLFSALFENRSIVPFVHFYLGVRPRINRGRCNRCGVCVDICPTDAIDLQKKKVITSKCMHVRCMKCTDTCPESAIEIHRPWMAESLKSL